VIIAMHHDQDMRNMGGLRKYMPITFWTAFIGSLALIGFPGFSGFFSKDAIIESVHASNLPGAGLSYWLLLISVFVTALYSFRLFFLVFFGKERMDDHTREHLRESPWVVTFPLIMLAIPSVFAGYVIGPVLFGDYFGEAIFVSQEHDVLGHLGAHYHGVLGFVLHGIMAPPFWLAMAGLFSAWLFYLHRPEWAGIVKQRLAIIYSILDRKYGFDDFNERVFAGGGRAVGRLLWRIGDVKLIDGLLVNGTARTVGWISARIRYLQTGYLYHYAFAMIIGLILLLSRFLFE